MELVRSLYTALIVIMTGKLRPLLDSGDIEKIYTTGSIYNSNHPRIQTIGIKREDEETRDNN